MFININDVFNEAEKYSNIKEIVESYYPSFFENTTELKIEGQTMGYTSRQLSNYFKEDTSDLFPTVISSYNFLLDNDILIPVYATSGVVKEVFYHLIVNPFRSYRILGFFTTQYNRVFIMTSNLSDVFGTIDKHSLKKLIAHELTHYFSYNFNRLFISFFGSLIKNFYIHFYNNLFENKVKISVIKKAVSRFYKHMIIFERNKMGNEVFVKHLNKVYKLIFRLFPNTEFVKTRLKSILTALVSVYFKGDMMGYIRNQSNVFYALQQAYVDLGYTSDESFVFQELVFPSEIVCIINQQRIQSNWYTLINRIKKSKPGVKINV